tara:strand:+ start:570 stop:1643 length:1074 start_codon:yes stop_codon:yes gene_type:complete
MIVLVTGGSGFIGSALIRYLILHKKFKVINLDKITYAANQDSLISVKDNELYTFEKADICEEAKVLKIFKKYKPNLVMHLAAESHVDRSISGPSEFMRTNIFGTYNLLESARFYYKNLSYSERKVFRFHHISTDEVYGDLDKGNDLFSEETPYSPSSPYSASKASSDHLVRAWGRTYNLPIVVSNCSNNYGPFHFPEKLVPHMILNAMHGKPMPLYGNGKQVRDWLYVEDHVRALIKIATLGDLGETYNVGGNNEKTNIEVVETICELMEELNPTKPKNIKNYKDLITFVKDRPGHDLRYAIDSTKIKKNLGWAPLETFDSGLRKTVKWYLNNSSWWKRVLSGDYKLERIGDLDNET